ncbi:MAG: OstA-like protein [Chitinophagales bacterium]
MKKFLLIYTLLCLWSNSFAQEDTVSSVKKVQILHADKLQFYTDKQGNPIRKLVGNVRLKQDSTLMYCDSAFLKKEKNTVDMFGHVVITDGDSITATSNKLNYDGNEKKAKLIGKAKLTDSQMEITSEILYYDRTAKLGYYLDNGTLKNDSTVLTSKKGYYHTDTKEAFFNEKVHIEDPKYSLDSDTLMFNTETKISEFYGNTTIYNDQSTIKCNNGTYDTNRQIATFGKGTTIFNDPQILKADSLYYEKNNGYGKAMKKYDWYDEEMKVSMKGTFAEYFENRKEIFSINRPLLEAQIEEDTLFMKGDTIIVINDASKSFKAYGNTRVYKSDLQSISDSLYYSKNDSMLKMFQKPIMWNEASEMKSDTIKIALVSGKVDKIYFINKAFIVTQSKGKLFDQIKGKKITGYFKDSKMYKMLVDKNAESLYFGKDDDDNYLGGNKANATKMWIYTKESKIKKIVFIDKPEAVFTPLKQMNNTMLYLKDFNVNFEDRPKSRFDL